MNRSAVQTDNWISCLWLRTTVYQNRGSVGARIGFQKTLDGEPMAPFVDDDHVTRIVHVVLFEVGVSFRRLSDNECAKYPIGKLNAWKITSQVRSYSSAAVYLNYSFFGLLHSVGWLSTDVSGQPIGPTFKGQKSSWTLDPSITSHVSVECILYWKYGRTWQSCLFLQFCKRA